jgi:hypothetical protein
MTELSLRLEHYLRDLIVILKGKGFAAREDRHTASANDVEYAIGRLMAFHEVISLLQQQAIAFGIPREELGLDDIEPERDLV